LLKELADVIARTLSIILDGSRQVGEGPKHWREANVTPLLEWQEGGPVELEASQIASIPWKVREQFIRENTSRHLEDRQIVRSSQQEFNKRWLCLANPKVFCD